MLLHRVRLKRLQLWSPHARVEAEAVQKTYGRPPSDALEEELALFYFQPAALRPRSFLRSRTHPLLPIHAPAELFTTRGESMTEEGQLALSVRFSK